jgi:hypothetical protein
MPRRTDVEGFDERETGSERQRLGWWVTRSEVD